MDIYETRRRRLKLLIKENFKGNQSLFSEKTGIKAPQVNRWLSETAAEKRAITEKSARNIEKRTEKIERWLDGVESAADTSKPTPYGTPESPKQPLLACEPKTNSEIETRLLEQYRQASDATRAVVDLALLPPESRAQFSTSIQLALTHLEAEAPGLLHEAKRLPDIS